jgi:hypothetical protein
VIVFLTHAPLDDRGQLCQQDAAAEVPRLVAVVATLSKGYDLDYIWKQIDRGPAKDAASYYIQASESGGEPPGRWWGPGAKRSSPAIGWAHKGAFCIAPRAWGQTIRDPALTWPVGFGQFAAASRRWALLAG